MLTKILKCVDTRSLFKCRSVSRQWLETSSGILTGRTDSILHFKDYECVQDCEIDFIPLEIKKSERLKEFTHCMKKCKNIPFAHFSFDFDNPSYFDERGWIGFLSVFAPPNPKLKRDSNQIQNPNQSTKIKCLHLKCDNTDEREELLLFTEKLRDLLLNKIPRLEKLGLELATDDDDTDDEEDVKNVKLFPQTDTESESTTTTTTKSPISVSVPVQLPYLKVLEIQPEMFLYLPGIVQDLMKAAIILTEIGVQLKRWDEKDLQSHIFHFLHSLGKLHLIKKMTILVNETVLSNVKKSTGQNEPSKSHFSLGFKLHELKLCVFARDISPPFHADATNFLSNLLESSKDTLEKLETSPLGFLSGLQFPNLTKLRTFKVTPYQALYLSGIGFLGIRTQIFPPGIRSRDKEVFPAVDDLSLKNFNWERAFPQEDSIPIFPRVHTLSFNDDQVKENVIPKLGLLCPNLKHCTIQKVKGKPIQLNFAQVGREIWTHLKQLESLEVDVDVNLRNHAFPALDSCFTGISIENCQRLYELMEAENKETRIENSSPWKLPESEEVTKLTQREHPSILDMKCLKTLVINPYWERRRYEGNKFFTTKITWISQDFAFKLMPNLQFNGGKPSTSS